MWSKSDVFTLLLIYINFSKVWPDVTQIRNGHSSAPLSMRISGHISSHRHDLFLNLNMSFRQSPKELCLEQRNINHNYFTADIQTWVLMFFLRALAYPHSIMDIHKDHLQNLIALSIHSSSTLNRCAPFSLNSVIFPPYMTFAILSHCSSCYNMN